jgi:periplasmic copper chaperone A
MFRIASLAAALLAATPLFAHDGVHVENAYALTSGPGAMSGAIFFEIVNHSTTSPDRLVAASSDVAQRVELHTHLIDANGVARMVEVEDGFAVEPGATHVLERGGDHVMLMGLTRPLADGDVIELRLVFEREGEMVIEVPVDLDRAPMQGGHGAHGHGGHGMGG